MGLAELTCGQHHCAAVTWDGEVISGVKSDVIGGVMSALINVVMSAVMSVVMSAGMSALSSACFQPNKDQ